MVGLVGTAAHYMTLALLVEVGSLDPVLATTVGFVVGGATNYFLNHRYTFKSSKGHLDAGPKFVVIAVLTGALNALIVHAGVHHGELNYLLVQVGATAAVFLANFALNSLWTFRETEVT